MKTQKLLIVLVLFVFSSIFSTFSTVFSGNAGNVYSADPVVKESAMDIQLPAPITTGGMPLMDALSNRASCRDFSDRELDAQTLSNLLWSAYGINRPDGRRTVPSALNTQEMELWVILKSGVYTYDAVANKLLFKLSGDNRHLAGLQEYSQKVPVTFVYIADLKKYKNQTGPREGRLSCATVGVGFIGQNVYLYAAANGLATVFRASIDTKAIAEQFKLGEDEVVLFAQSIGYPAE